MPWIQRKLRDSLVYVKTRPDGAPAVASDGRVAIKYKPDPDAKVYRAALRNLAKTGDPAHERPIALDESSAGQTSAQTATQTATKTSSQSRPAKLPGDAIVVYTDGACTGNPGPSGIGVVILDGNDRRELSEYLGEGTNNIAELTAIERALEAVAEQCERPVVVHSDSSYSIGLLTKNWKAKANQVLVKRLRTLASRFPRLELVKVKGHAGIPENERADELARLAIERRG